MEIPDDVVLGSNGRYVIEVSSILKPELSALVPLLCRFLSRSSTATGNMELLDRDIYLSGNGISVSRLKLSTGIEYHTKLVRSPDPESTYLQIVTSRYPGLLEDMCVLLPTVIDVVDKSTGEIKFYIHVSRWQRSECTLAELIVRLWMARMHQQLNRALLSFGRFLSGFHSRYPKLMHNDMNPANVLIVETASGTSFVLADCAGLDDEVGDDYGSFLKSLEVLADGGFGDDFLQSASSSFSDGYRASV